jgi:hypothetical protein
MNQPNKKPNAIVALCVISESEIIDKMVCSIEIALMNQLFAVDG